MKKKVKVVAAVIENNQEEVLCALRAHDMSIPNKWEFPGGKVEEGENLQQALEREIQEELRCDIKAENVIYDHTHEYDSFIINLIALEANIVSGTPVATEHAKLIWLPKENLDSVIWAPADIPAVETLIKQTERAHS
ncbi:(deoxy)nucleoside triphosphate pyrophosphohydrolase [Gracilibacillus salinarum]|uniref:8-oxo-dGTP diphosphatase n=1 Tax=Gracilibacillus salinarum TaxID=2932255 RepID=A0ABY4GH67_9BACI|nr:(deoxy)nucleoside triphosphate pyrophosphohydrolase [Gracilibacillus salinarum]UOQ83584.1 (deoxy)nucleoside triphosphate pyrophosphohydrolase [Gracilibacillus salinarum]